MSEFYRDVDPEVEKSEWDVILQEHANLINSRALIAKEALFKDSNLFRVNKRLPSLPKPYIEVQSPRGPLMRSVVLQQSGNDLLREELIDGVFTMRENGIKTVLHFVVKDFQVKNSFGTTQFENYQEICVEALEDDDMICYIRDVTKIPYMKPEVEHKFAGFFAPWQWAVRGDDAPLASYMVKLHGKLIPVRKLK